MAQDQKTGPRYWWICFKLVAQEEISFVFSRPACPPEPGWYLTAARRAPRSRSAAVLIVSRHWSAPRQINSSSSLTRVPSTSSLLLFPTFLHSYSNSTYSTLYDRLTHHLSQMRMLEDEALPGAQDTIYLCNFRVTVDGEWLCLKELQDVSADPALFPATPSPCEPPPHMFIARDPYVIERRNLVNISKLIVKELIETSLKYGRMLDSDHMPLQHFFIVLEHVLRHGLKPKKGLLGPKKELWDILQVVEKLNYEAQDITTSVRELPTVKTAMGRARAWLRLALMQKKLADYLKLLIDHRDDILSEYFEPDALLMSDEAIVIVGLLVGLNVIDCNLCVKEEDLDCQQGVIDFSLYLRSSHHNSVGESPEDDPDIDNMTTVLDQKNYIEELNRHLNATVGDLQAKVETLTTTNTLLKEDLAIAKKHIASLMGENSNLKADKKKDVNSERKDEGGGGEELERLRKEIEQERKARTEAESELKLQISLKAEMEVATKLLEKDSYEKQDTIVSLRRQLEDIKSINLEMYKKLQECETSLKHKTELVAKLEAKTFALSDTLHFLDDKKRETEKGKTKAEEALMKASNTSAELKVEREWRQSLQSAVNSHIGETVEQKEKILQLQQELTQLQEIAKRYVTLQEDHYRLREKSREQDETLDMVGRELSACKLQVSELKGEREGGSVSSEEQQNVPWVKDKEAANCSACQRTFSLTRRKHHCRHCGEIFCHNCSDNQHAIPPNTKPVRVCDQCNLILLSRYSVLN